MASRRSARKDPRPREGTSPKPQRATGVQLGEDRARATILFGASRVFAEEGIRTASVEQILAAATVSRRTFYRFFRGKDDVAAELYRLGTEGLLTACSAAIAEEDDSLRRLERCVDIHLRNTGQLGRLVFVLGGEAQHHESPLYARRLEVHDALVELLAAREPTVDPLLFRTLIMALESGARRVLEQGDEGRHVSQDEIERTRRVMIRLASAALRANGPGITPLPPPPAC